MRKDTFGICLCFYAVFGFVLAILGYTTILALLLGFVILVHKDQWLTMQVMQAFFLAIIPSVVNAFIDVIRPIYNIPVVGTVFSTIFGIITAILYIIVLIFAIIAIVKTAKEQDANVPIAKGFAEKAFGLVRNISYSQASPQNNYGSTQAPEQNLSQNSYGSTQAPEQNPIPPQDDQNTQ